jgi:hypothetical protein
MENTIDRCHDALHLAGWSVGDAGIITPRGLAWLVTCTRGKHMIQTTALMQAEAWQLAVEQSEALRMFSPDCGPPP